VRCGTGILAAIVGAYAGSSGSGFLLVKQPLRLASINSNAISFSEVDIEKVRVRIIKSLN
jgi:hypothetical protein